MTASADHRNIQKPDTTMSQGTVDPVALIHELRANLSDALQDDFRLTATEADQATSDFSADWKAGPVFPTVPHTPVADAYARWATTVDPLLLAEREAEQRVAGIEFAIADAKSHMDTQEQVSSLALSNTYLQLGAATIKLHEAIAARKAASTPSTSPHDQDATDTWKTALAPGTLVVGGVADDPETWEHHDAGGVQQRHSRSDTADDGSDPDARLAAADPETSIHDGLQNHHEMTPPEAATRAAASIRAWDGSVPPHPDAAYLNNAVAAATLSFNDAHQSNDLRFTTAYLDAALAAAAELTANSSRVSRTEPFRATQVAQDLAAAESAITLLRDNRDRNGYTPQDAATARALRGVLDAAQAWDQVPARAPADELQEDLQPDRVRNRPTHGPDTVVIEAGFGSTTTTITVTRRELPGDEPRYWFRQDDPSDLFRQGPLPGSDPLQFGVAASGDRFSHPDRTDLYAELGRQIRDHLTGMADAVAAQRQTLAEMEATKVEATQVLPDHGVRRGNERSR